MKYARLNRLYAYAPLGLLQTQTYKKNLLHWILYPTGDILKSINKEITLADIVKKDYSGILLNKLLVKVPKIKDAKTLQKAESKRREHVSLAPALMNLLIQKAIEKAKSDEKDKPKESEHSNVLKYKIIDDEESEAAVGGYGSSSAKYGMAALSKHVSYSKIFSYLGKFRSKSMYEDLDSDPNSFLNKALEQANSFSLIDMETVEKGSKFIKYVKPQMTDISQTSLAPAAGMNSAEWEQYKLFMKLEPALFALKNALS
jgi:hypothetical protein